MSDTNAQFEEVIQRCKTVFTNKMKDYGLSWRILRPSSLTDQIFIKASRIRSLEDKKVSKVNEGVEPEYIGIINYSIPIYRIKQKVFLPTLSLPNNRGLNCKNILPVFQPVLTFKSLAKNQFYTRVFPSLFLIIQRRPKLVTR